MSSTLPLHLPLDTASPQRDAPLSPPILNLTPSPLPRQEKDSDVVSDIEEEEKLCDTEKEKLIPKDWAGQVEEEESNPREDLIVDSEQKEAVLSIREALIEKFKKGRGQEFVRGLRLWHNLKPRRARVLCAWVGEEETDLSFEPGALHRCTAQVHCTGGWSSSGSLTEPRLA